MRTNHFWRRAPLVGALVAALCGTPQLASAQPSAAVASANALIDFNQATEAQLDSLRGIGPATTRRILQAREERAFSDWADLIRRVRGIGSTSAASYSAQGFVVNGASFTMTAAPAR